MSPPPPHVLIIGAGTGGLCLAHGLRRARHQRRRVRTPPPQVTLLGDAIHTMTPGRGVGANTALRDARLLCRELTRAAAGDKTLLQAVADYEAAMVPYGLQRVAESLNRSGTNGDDRMYRPVVGRPALLGARGYFGVTSRVLRLRRKFVDDFHTYEGDED